MIDGGKYIIALLLFATFVVSAKTQRLVEEQAFVERVLERSPQLKAAETQVLQQEKLQKTAWDVPNPEIQMESPTGDFYTIGAIQSFASPNVYAQQQKLQKALTKLSDAALGIEQATVRKEAGVLYVDWKYARQLCAEYEQQDSLWQLLARTAKRQNEQGEISSLEYMLVQNKAAEAQQQYLWAQAQRERFHRVAQFYLGTNDSLSTDSLKLESITVESVGETALQRYWQQEQRVKEQALKAQQQQWSPSFYVGYMNQGQRNSPIALRFKAGISVPLWFPQYKGRQQAAKLDIEITQSLQAQQQMDRERRVMELQTEIIALERIITNYNNTIIPNNQKIISDVERLTRAGAINYAQSLTLLAETLQSNLRYYEKIWQHQRSARELAFWFD